MKSIVNQLRNCFEYSIVFSNTRNRPVYTFDVLQTETPLMKSDNLKQVIIAFNHYCQEDTDSLGDKKGLKLRSLSLTVLVLMFFTHLIVLNMNPAVLLYTVLQICARIGLKQNLLRSTTFDIIT